MNDESPEIVSLSSSFDLSAFPSESRESVEPSSATPDTPAAAPASSLGAPAAAEASTHKTATVTEFPVQATRPPSGTVLPPDVPVTVSLVEVLERQGGLDWRRAVSVVRQICLHLKDQSPHQPIILDPRNIIIDNRGHVRLLPGQLGGDPLVIQLGRLLRTMLMGNDAPPELRLLLAQATFELPIFESVEDVERALQQLERLEESAGDGSGFRAPIVEPPPTPGFEPQQRALARTILPPPYSYARRTRRQGFLPVGVLFYRYGSRIATACIVIAILGGLILTFPTLIWPVESTSGPVESVAIASTGTTSPPVLPEPVASSPPAAPVSPPAARAVPPPAIAPIARDRTHAPAVVRQERGGAADLTGSVGVTSRSAATPTPTPPPVTSARESERRATTLMAQGQTADAVMAFDALVMSNPLYEPKASELTPESLAAFRTSQRMLLPVIAQRTYDRARTALNAGDVDRAVSLSKEASSILDRPLTDPPAQLRDQVRELLDTATAAKAAADEIVYNETDTGIVPPRPLSRQFPLTSPIGVPPHRVGTLEMIVDREGGVENVKLFTPLNRYHERMVVSAAKAWRYRPATKNGRPVKCRVVVKVNLPESGTDD